MIHIDGSQGEGGGQVLRTALTLSMLTGQALQITDIRARRSRPGLQPQHLAAVRAAVAVSRGRAEGAAPGKSALFFEPGKVDDGRYEFDIGTAGSTSLVLQTIFLPLSRLEASSSVTLTGGTHVPMSPCFHYLDMQWLNFMRQMGCSSRLALDMAGFYPKGGGRIHAGIHGSTTRLVPLRITERGPLRRIRGISAVANMEVNIAERLRQRAVRRLTALGCPVQFDLIRLSARSKGAFVLLLAEFEGQARCCYYALADKGRPSDRLADEAVSALEAFLATDAVVDEYLADQLLLPMALAFGPSEMRTARITGHLVTNAQVIQQFLPVNIEIEGEMDQPGLIRVIP